MPTTPLRGWTYPAEGQNPYFATIEGLFNAQDADVDAIADAVANGVIPPTLVNAKGDLIVATGADVVDRLAVGSNGQVLTAASGQATGLQWATPAASISPTIVDAKGDLIVATAADTVARLPVGTDGQVVIADASQASGVRWGRTGYRVSMAGGFSAVVSNTTTPTTFNKTLPIPANMLGVLGAQVDVTARVTASANVPATIVLDGFICGVRLGYVSVNMVQSANQEYGYWGSGVVFGIGATGYWVGGPSLMGPSLNNDLRMGSTFAAGGSGLDTTAAGSVSLQVTFSTADAGVSAQLVSLTVKITYPDAVVS